MGGWKRWRMSTGTVGGPGTYGRSVTFRRGAFVVRLVAYVPVTGTSPPAYASRAFKNRPVCEAGHAATFSGVPTTNTSPPACPPSGPRSIT